MAQIVWRQRLHSGAASTTGTPPSSSQPPSSPPPVACTSGGNEMTARYLSLKEVAQTARGDNAVAYRLPEPDALIESIRGWKPETIDAWNKACPRPRHRRRQQQPTQAQDRITRKRPSPTMRLGEGLYPSFETGQTFTLPSQSTLGGMILHPSSRRRTEPAALTLRLIMLMLRSVRAAYTPASGSTGCSSDAVIPAHHSSEPKKKS